MLNAIVITIGDEILIGQIVDTNSAWLGSELGKIGVRVNRVLSVGDNYWDIFSSINESISKFDIVLVTGGLGPTKDDKTKQILCDVFGGELVRDEKSYEIANEILSRGGVEMNELNIAQSLVPNSCEVILNHNGTAPGMLFERD